MEDLKERVRLQEELLDDLKDELITLSIKYSDLLDKLNNEMDRVFFAMNLIR
jgi:hypothetical protein